MYQKLTMKDAKGRILKQYHHVYLNQSFLQDCRVWLQFLERVNGQPNQLCRPFVDFSDIPQYQKLFFYSDASKNSRLGMGAVFNNNWIVAKWGSQFIQNCDPSIEFLELFALTAAVLTWSSKFPCLHNSRVTIFCDNEAVMHMVNNMASSCPSV